MRYIGNKERLLPQIHKVLLERNIKGNSFFDFFSGTSNVGKYFKKLGYRIYSSDIMYFSYVLQRAYITTNKTCEFKVLIDFLKINKLNDTLSPLNRIVNYLNNIKPIKGFIYMNYTPEGTKNLSQPRMFFSSENGMIIDAIRDKIESWYINKFISDEEYYVLLACLIESVPFYANISGVYAAFHKKWDARALKKFTLRTIELIDNKKENYSFNMDSINLLSEIEVDLLYLDPPYNQRQYAPNYHILETIAKNDNPEIKGISGMRDYSSQKSKFCNAKTAIVELERIISCAKYKYLILSYNSEGLLNSEDILKIMSRYGNVELVKFDYLRYKSNGNGNNKNKKYIEEHLYILKK